MSHVLFLALLACSGMAQDVPLFPRDGKKNQDWGAVNQNYSDLSLRGKDKATTSIAPQFCPSGQTLTGAYYSKSGATVGGTCKSITNFGDNIVFGASVTFNGPTTFQTPPDPPGSWTCTVRTNTSAAIANTAAATTTTASCTGTEKIIAGGCTMASGSSASGSTTMFAGGVSGQGWVCNVILSGTNGSWTVTATANCCL